MKLLCLILLFASSVSSLPAHQDELIQEIEPQFVAETDTFFFLFTRENPGVAQRLTLRDLNSILSSNYDVRRPTRFLIHGFQGDSNAEIVVEIREEYLKSYDLNIIAVDWGLGANTPNYITARNRVNEVGPVLAQFCDFLQENNLLDFSRTYIIGGSLGAHIAGMAAKSMTRGRVRQIHGLDPAGFLFNVADPSTRLAVGDAEYVECIHTDPVLGIVEPICDSNFYPNGGANQPGCTNALCDHGRAFSFFAESLNNNQFWARRCNNINEISGVCTGPEALMAGEPGNYLNNVFGIYALRTNANPPFAQGRF